MRDTSTMIMNKLSKDSRGFTLVEIAIVTLISGLIIVSIAAAFNLYLTRTRLNDTKERLRTSGSLITSFQGTTGGYPCPADPTLSVDNPNFGLADCTVASFTTTRDVDGVAGNDRILFGALPIQTLRSVSTQPLSNELSWDGWNSKFTYAVSESLTTNNPNLAPFPNRYRFDRGIIVGVDEFGNPTAGLNGDAHYTLFSHGPNKRGAFTLEGVRVENCGSVVVTPPTTQPTTPAVGSATETDRENCDNDDRFVQAPGFFVGDSNNGYDDIVFFFKQPLSSLWGALVDGSGALTSDIRNLNQGNVGIKNAAPSSRLTVGTPGGGDGVIEASTNVRADLICQRDGSNCFRPGDISEPDDLSTPSARNSIECPDGQVMTGMTVAGPPTSPSDPPEGAMRSTCAPLIINIPAGVTCPAGEFVGSVNTNGTVLSSAGNPCTTSTVR